MDARTRTGVRHRIARIAGRFRYANVAATLALIVAVGTGGAYAAGQIGSNDIKRNAVRAKHIKKKQVKAKHVRKNSIRTPKIKRRAVTAAKLAPHAIAARAYARVDFDGTIASGAARNITNANITKPGNDGVYCLHDLPFDPDLVVAAPRYSQRIVEYLHGGGGTLQCPGDTQIRITLRNIASTSLQDGSFAVVLF